MEVIEIPVKYGYSCQRCQRWFYLPVEVQIIPNEYPLCSKKCLFILCYRIIASYSQKDIDYLKNYYHIDISDADNKQKLIFEVVKNFIKSNLHSINDYYHYQLLSFDSK